MRSRSAIVCWLAVLGIGWLSPYHAKAQLGESDDPAAQFFRFAILDDPESAHPLFLAYAVDTPAATNKFVAFIVCRDVDGSASLWGARGMAPAAVASVQGEWSANITPLLQQDAPFAEAIAQWYSANGSAPPSGLWVVVHHASSVAALGEWMANSTGNQLWGSIGWRDVWEWLKLLLKWIFDEVPPTEDSDDDNVPDAVDHDDNNNGIPDHEEDDDGDGIPNNRDPDDDNDGIPDHLEDDDGDGIPNNRDRDDDGDGIPDHKEDDDGDGIPNNQDADDDGDGVPDQEEDYDNDGIPNNEDHDDDGDGIPDHREDDDADGVPNNRDRDDDGDGVGDHEEDGDNDGVLNNEDHDDDGDGLDDHLEDDDDDGTANNQDSDDDDDGVKDHLEDDDDDGKTNNTDDDDDGDGRSDQDEDDDNDGATNADDDDDDGDGTADGDEDDDDDGMANDEDTDDDGDGTSDDDESGGGGGGGACKFPYDLNAASFHSGTLNHWPDGGAIPPTVDLPYAWGQDFQFDIARGGAIYPVVLGLNGCSDSAGPILVWLRARQESNACQASWIRARVGNKIIANASVPVSPAPPGSDVAVLLDFDLDCLPGVERISKLMYQVVFEYSSDDRQSWRRFGSAWPTCWYVMFNRASGLQEPRFDRGVEAAIRYASGLRDPALIARAMMGGIAGEICYDPLQTEPEAGGEYDLIVYDWKRAQCGTNSKVLKYLCETVSIAGTPRVVYSWGGSGSGVDAYKQPPAIPGDYVSFQLSGPANDRAEANPHFKYHSVLNFNGTFLDASYGRVGLLPAMELATIPGVGVAQMTGDEVPPPFLSSFVCEHAYVPLTGCP